MSITAPQGYEAAALSAGIKKSGKPDLAIIFSEVPAVVAGVFTTNQFKAAPILVSQKQIRSGFCQAIIANAGNANCGTGQRGLADAWKMVEETAKALAVKKEQVLITSTGSINHFLPMKKILATIPKVAAKLSRSGGHEFARAIMTTDLRSKEIAIKVDGYTVAGAAKGSGMIYPNMATMHAFITTDAAIDRRTLRQLLRRAVSNSFNLITVDQCQSTNDCVFVLANGLSGKKIRGGAAVKKFAKALEEVCVYLAKEIARDGEGATQLIEVQVKGAKNEAEAKLVARAIACSDLLKCAIYGRDRNLGRVLGAAGSTKVKLDPNKMKADIKFYKDWALVTCDLGVGKSRGTAWGCDLTEGYVKINADYHT